MRNCEAVLYVTSLDASQATAADLLAYARGHWKAEHLHWLRDVVWREDRSTLRTGNAPEVMSALTNLVITLFRLQELPRSRQRRAATPRTPAGHCSYLPSGQAKHAPGL
jgi:predicted transposase YbfD/YdcC